MAIYSNLADRYNSINQSFSAGFDHGPKTLYEGPPTEKGYSTLLGDINAVRYCCQPHFHVAISDSGICADPVRDCPSVRLLLKVGQAILGELARMRAPS